MVLQDRWSLMTVGSLKDKFHCTIIFFFYFRNFVPHTSDLTYIAQLHDKVEFAVSVVFLHNLDDIWVFDPAQDGYLVLYHLFLALTPQFVDHLQSIFFAGGPRVCYNWKYTSVPLLKWILIYCKQCPNIFVYYIKFSIYSVYTSDAHFAKMHLFLMQGFTKWKLSGASHADMYTKLTIENWYFINKTVYYCFSNNITKCVILLFNFFPYTK